MIFIKKKNKYYYIKYILIIIIFSIIKTKLILYKLAKYKIKIITVNYASPLYLGIAFSIIMLFSNINIKSKILIKLISFFAPLTYGVYLSHNHLLVRLYIIQKYFLWILKYKSINIVIIEIMCSFGVFMLCCIIDFIRLCFKN